MSKKDYQAIARAIFAARAQVLDSAVGDATGAFARRALNIMQEHVASALAADNARFDRALFVEACETGRCKGMPQ